MSRREPGPGRQGRHARDRLQATLGGPTRHPLLKDADRQESFQHHGPADGPGGSAPDAATPGERHVPEQPASEGRTDPLHVRLRWRVGLRVALLLAVPALCAVVWFWLQTAAGRPEVLPLGDITSQQPGHSPGTGSPGGVSDGADAAGEAAGEPDGRVVVHVAGAVAKPGVVQLPSGSRVHQAIAAAGGAAPGADLNRLNLALVLTDGQKILVPREGEAHRPDESAAAPEGTGAEGLDGSNGGRADGSKVNLNTASLEELDALPKVGPVLAQRILDWRKDHGSFKSTEDLDAVDGVGPKMLEALLPLVTV